MELGIRSTNWKSGGKVCDLLKCSSRLVLGSPWRCSLGFKSFSISLVLLCWVYDFTCVIKSFVNKMWLQYINSLSILESTYSRWSDDRSIAEERIRERVIEWWRSRGRIWNTSRCGKVWTMGRLIEPGVRFENIPPHPTPHFDRVFKTSLSNKKYYQAKRMSMSISRLLKGWPSQ